MGRIAAEIPVSPLGGVFLLVFGDPGFKPKIGWELERFIFCPILMKLKTGGRVTAGMQFRPFR